MSTIAMSLEDLLRQAGGGRERLVTPAAPVDPAIEARILKDLLVARQRPCPFAVGDLVTQIKAYERYKVSCEGAAAIVSRLLPEPLDMSPDDTVVQNDMVILLRSRGQDGRVDVVEFAVESWRFERYTGEVA